MDRRISLDVRKSLSAIKLNNYHTVAGTNQVEETLRDMLKVKRKRTWSKRFVVLEENCLYTLSHLLQQNPAFISDLKAWSC